MRKCLICGSSDLKVPYRLRNNKKVHSSYKNINVYRCRNQNIKHFFELQAKFDNPRRRYKEDTVIALRFHIKVDGRINIVSVDYS